MVIRNGDFPVVCVGGQGYGRDYNPFAQRPAVTQFFVDRDDLPAGESFDLQIERAVNESDVSY